MGSNLGEERLQLPLITKLFGKDMLVILMNDNSTMVPTDKHRFWGVLIYIAEGRSRIKSNSTIAMRYWHSGVNYCSQIERLYCVNDNCHLRDTANQLWPALQ